jgi:hypothetical protein
MKANTITQIMFIACISFCSVVSVSCEDNNSDSKYYVNSWILANMNEY